MSDRPKLTTPRLRVVMDDGTEFEVQALNVDMLTFDRQRARLGWPTASDAPFVWLTYLAWSAAMRESMIPELPLAEFEQRAWQVSNADDDEDKPTTVDPTTPAVEGG